MGILLILTMKHHVFLHEHPVFTGAELAEHLASHGPVGARTRETFLAYYTKTGRVQRIRQGLYAVVPPGCEPGDHQVDSFHIAAKLAPDAVVSHHAAVAFHGWAYNLWHHWIYMASKPVAGRFRFDTQVYRGCRFPAALVRSGRQHFAVGEHHHRGVRIRVASMERTLVDCLHRPDLSGDWEEIWRCFEPVEFLDLDLVIAYTRLLDNSTTAAKVGFFLDQHRDFVSGLDESHLGTLAALAPKHPHRMEPPVPHEPPRPCRVVRPWNLIVPVEVLERGWEEPLCLPSP